MWKRGGGRRRNYSGPVRTKIKFFLWLLICNHTYGIASISVTWFIHNMRTATGYYAQHLCRFAEHNVIRRILYIFIMCPLILLLYFIGQWGALGGAVESLRYKPEGRGFDSRWYHWDLSLTQSFRSHYGPGVDSACNRNECQEYFLGSKGDRCVGLTTLPTSCADCLESLKLLEPSEFVPASNGLAVPVYRTVKLFGAYLKI